MDHHQPSLFHDNSNNFDPNPIYDFQPEDEYEQGDDGDEFELSSCKRRRNTCPSDFSLRVKSSAGPIEVQLESEKNIPSNSVQVSWVTSSSSNVKQEPCCSSTKYPNSQQEPVSSSSVCGDQIEADSSDYKYGGSFSESRSSRNAWGNESYADIITNAIKSKPSKKAKLGDIYQFFVEKLPYFNKHKESKGWKNSVRHNLSLGKQFKRKQSSDPKEKGSFWVVDETPGQAGTPPRSNSMSSASTRTVATAKRKSSVVHREAPSVSGASVDTNRPASRCKSETSVNIFNTNLCVAPNSKLGQVRCSTDNNGSLFDQNYYFTPTESTNDLASFSVMNHNHDQEFLDSPRARAFTSDSISHRANKNRIWLDPLVSSHNLQHSAPGYQIAITPIKHQIDHQNSHQRNTIHVSNSENNSTTHSMQNEQKTHADVISNFCNFPELSLSNQVNFPINSKNSNLMSLPLNQEKFGTPISVNNEQNMITSVSPQANFQLISTNMRPNALDLNFAQTLKDMSGQTPIFTQDSNQNISIQGRSSHKLDPEIFSPFSNGYSGFDVHPSLSPDMITDFETSRNSIPTSIGYNVAPNHQIFPSNSSKINRTEDTCDVITSLSNFALDPSEQMMEWALLCNGGRPREGSLAEDISQISPSIQELFYDNPLTMVQHGHQSSSMISGHQNMSSAAQMLMQQQSSNNHLSSSSTAESIQRFSNMTIQEPTHGHNHDPISYTAAGRSTNASLNCSLDTMGSRYPPAPPRNYMDTQHLISSSHSSVSSVPAFSFGTHPAAVTSLQHMMQMATPAVAPHVIPTTSVAFAAHT